MCGEQSWLEETVDPRLQGNYSKNYAKTLVEIGLSCVVEDRKRRPNMAAVVQAPLDCEDVPKKMENMISDALLLFSGLYLL